MREYNHKKIEEKWRKRWAEVNLYKTEENGAKPKCYVLDEFPYPSGEGLHTGHTRIYTASDIYARMKRMQGFNVLHPSGWDAFGLPAEQFAIKHKVHPSLSVKKNTERYKEQMNNIGLSYDWEREINTTDPAYYKWTQWAFLKMFKKGLAYESFAPINWCPTCQTGLANEDLDGGKCERCGSAVIKKPMRQWVIRITKYADRLLNDLNTLSEWPEAIKEQQRNWIGRSEGAEIQFPVISHQSSGKFPVQHVTVFTTRPDTLFGATFLAVSAELAKKWLDMGWQASEEVKKFVQNTLDDEATRAIDVVPEKEGIATGIMAMNPANQEKIPVWIANYVLSGYGTGAIMAVPAHDERDLEFATKYVLPVISVIQPVTGTPQENPESRESIVAILRNKKGELLSLDWGKEGGSLFIGGGREGDEDIVACATREILEETGYADVRFVAQTTTIHHQYFAHSKNVARRITAHGLLFDLLGDTKRETALESDEQGKFTLEWLAPEVAKSRIKDELHHTCFELLIEQACYTRGGLLENSGKFNGMANEEAKKALTKFVGGKEAVTYRLKDWVFSRQRYWGEPIPIIHCTKDGIVPVPESELPVLLPEVKSYAPTGTGESPLADIPEWVNTTCPKCGGPAKRETNTMPQWAGSSWYYLRFMDPKNPDALVGKEKEKYWAPVDVYVGGAEHVTRHLIYARFWHKFLYDIGVVSTIEPFKKRRGVGLVLGVGGVKMSKRLGNVINPDDIVEQFGADSLRVYEMFMGPFEGAIPWSTDNLIGARRFIERVWRLQEKISNTIKIENETTVLLNQTMKKVGEDIEGFAFNTAISQLMIFLNHLEKLEQVPHTVFQKLVLLLAPFAPHLSDELWEELGNSGMTYHEAWPVYDLAKILSETITIAIQINGKLRDTLIFGREEDEEGVKKKALASPVITKWLLGKTPKKIIYIPGRIVNIVC